MKFDWKAALVDLLVYVVTNILPKVLTGAVGAGIGIAGYHAVHAPTVKVQAVAPADCPCKK